MVDTLFADYLALLETLHENCRRAIQGLSVDALDWQPGPEMNSLTVLAMHLAGAERYWIGDIAGQDPSGRVRAEEFKSQGLDADTLVRRLSTTLDHSRGILERLTMDDLSKSRTLPGSEGAVTVSWALAHALEHTALHTGHIEITRQLWDQKHQV